MAQHESSFDLASGESIVLTIDHKTTYYRSTLLPMLPRLVFHMQVDSTLVYKDFITQFVLAYKYNEHML